MAGIAIGSRGAGRDLDDPVNDELWGLLAERRAFVFLHPSGVPDAHRQRDFYLAQLVGYPMETALAVARLVFGRVLERFDLTMCLAHGEGLLSGDDASGKTSFSPGRAQLLILTLLVALQYVMQVIHNPAAFPQIPGSWVAALGGSQVVYLGGKAQSLLFGGIKDRFKTGG